MKQNVIALVFGGRSSEHSVALRSAATIHAALMALGHRVHCVGIDREGNWRYQGEPRQFPGAVDRSAPLISIRPGHRSLSYTTQESGTVEIGIDLLFRHCMAGGGRMEQFKDWQRCAVCRVWAPGC